MSQIKDSLRAFEIRYELLSKGWEHRRLVTRFNRGAMRNIFHFNGLRRRLRVLAGKVVGRNV